MFGGLRSLLGATVVLLVVAMIPVSLINGAVRFFGGSNPHLLSLRHLSNKVKALGSLAIHVPFHPFSGCRRANDPLIRRAAARHRLPVAFVRRVVEVESGGHRHRISRAGAMGVMQLMPTTADELGVDDPFDAEENIDAGTRYLAFLWKRYRGDRRRVAAAYNAGPSRVPRRGRMRLPAETRAYVRRVVGSVRACASTSTSKPCSSKP